MAEQHRSIRWSTSLGLLSCRQNGKFNPRHKSVKLTQEDRAITNNWGNDTSRCSEHQKAIVEINWNERNASGHFYRFCRNLNVKTLFEKRSLRSIGRA